jgi:hypothetical protein
MSEVLAARLAMAHAAQCGPLRTQTGLEVCVDGEVLWLRAEEADESLQKRLRGLPAAELFHVKANGALCRVGSRVPQGFLPLGPWTPLSKWMGVTLPVSALAGRLQNRVSLHLVPSNVPREPNSLLTSLSTWAAYCETAPQVRLDCWHFAVSAAGQVLVRGLPLPPLPGMRLIEEQGIAVTCGQSWAPRVDAKLLGPLFNLSPNDVLLWTAEDHREIVTSDQFVKATRSAVRTTLARSASEGLFG